MYPEPDSPLRVVETTTELERQVGDLRQRVQAVARDGLQSLRGGVDRVVTMENKVGSRFDKLLAKDETVTPNGLYVGIVTLASMVFTRHRTFSLLTQAPSLSAGPSLL